MEPETWTVALAGSAVAALPEEEREFEFIEPAPKYSTNTDTGKTQLLTTIKLKDQKMDYYINKTSARTVARELKTDLTEEQMKQWIGTRWSWTVVQQQVGKDMKDVLYINQQIK